MSYIEGKVIVITGAASGFGKLVTEKAIQKGAKVVAADINQKALESLEASIQENAGEIACVETDVTNSAQMQRLSEVAVERFGAVDVLINNAGVMPLAFFADHKTAQEAWDRCIDINFKGVLNGISAVHDQMIQQGRGHIINLSSIYGNFPVAGGGVYGATKVAVDFLSESLRQESLGKIKVTNVKPTGVPGTGLGAGMVNPTAFNGVLGANAETYMQQFCQGSYWRFCHPNIQTRKTFNTLPLIRKYIAEQIIYAIDQPWGVVISEITVRASGDAYVI